MNYRSISPIAPPSGAKAPGRNRYSLLPIGAIVLSALFLTGCLGFGSAQSSAATGPSKTFPIQGQWVLVDTDNARFCQTYQEFRSDRSTTDVKNGKTTVNQAKGITYVIKPTYVLVSYGGYNYETWTIKGPDDLELALTSPYSVTKCRYHRK